MRYVLGKNPHVHIYVPDDPYFTGTTLPPAFLTTDARPELPANMRYFRGAGPPAGRKGWSAWTDVQLTTVNITALRDGIFFADLIFSNGKEVSARPSDSIALALRTGASIFAAEEILDEAGVAIPDEQEDEVEKFREFLDTISPEDFGRAT